MAILLLVIGIFLFIGLIVAHEFGHFIAARRNGVQVEEFGIFFPPTLYKRKMRGGWNFTINALPLGGFVKLKGEHDSDTAPGSFGAASLWAKTQIMAAGVIMNLVIALLLLTFLALIGMPKLVNNQFTVASDTKVTKSEVLATYVEPNSAAAKAGIQTRDTIISIGQVGKPATKVTSVTGLTHLTKSLAGKQVLVSYSHKGVTKSSTVTLLTSSVVDKSKNTDNPKGYLGLSGPAEFTLQRSTWSAPVVAVGFSAQITKLTFQGLGKAVAGLGSIVAGTVTGNSQARTHGQSKASSQVSGPVGIYFVLQTSSQLGFQFMLLIIAIISLTLAIMNILPIPALDGGRLWITLVTRGIFKRPLSPAREEAINASGFVGLLLLIVVISIVDVKRFF
ncbi:site-2 protease family protein [Candidatus Saccharibacteria bacterium]|nr:site-2 protease family protein [Candidatus Saccharibacteria bacterium]